MKILITGGTSATALKLLKAFNGAEVVFGDYGSVPAMKTDLYSFETLGEFNGDTLAHTLLNNCLDLSIDKLLPLRKDEIEAVSKSAVLFSEFNIEVMLPNAKEIDTFLKEKSPLANNWAVFENGNLLFATEARAFVLAKAKAENLTGAFYFDDATMVLMSV